MIEIKNATKKYGNNIALQDVSFTNETYLHVPLYVPSGTKELYEVADNWKNFFNIIEFDWEAPKYTISATCNNPQYGSITGGGDYYYGDTVTLIASPNDGYYFKNWTENGLEVCATPIYSFVVDGDRTLTAVFDILAPNEYSVSATCNPLAAGTIQGNHQLHRVEPHHSSQRVADYPSE